MTEICNDVIRLSALSSVRQNRWKWSTIICAVFPRCQYSTLREINLFCWWRQCIFLTLEILHTFIINHETMCFVWVCREQWTEMECREPKQTKLLTENEFKVVMDEFLGGIKPDTPSSQISGISSQAALTISEFIGSIGGEPIEVPTRLSLEDLLTRNATKELREALFKIYTRLCMWPVSVEAALIVAAAPTKRPSRMSMKKK